MQIIQFIDTLLSFIVSSLSTLLQFIKFIVDLPGLLITLLVSFPPFIRMGFIIIFTMLVIALVVRVKNYLS